MRRRRIFFGLVEASRRLEALSASKGPSQDQSMFVPAPSRYEGPPSWYLPQGPFTFNYSVRLSELVLCSPAVHHRSLWAHIPSATLLTHLATDALHGLTINGSWTLACPPPPAPVGHLLGVGSACPCSAVFCAAAPRCRPRALLRTRMYRAELPRSTSLNLVGVVHAVG